MISGGKRPSGKGGTVSLAARSERAGVIPPETRVRESGGIPPETLAKLDVAVGAWIDRRGYLEPYRNVPEAARAIGTTTGLLTAYFLQRYGEDFRVWRSRVRIREAKSLMLSRPELSIAEIGRRVGILDRSNFTNQFKRFTNGLTPLEWKKSQG